MTSNGRLILVVLNEGDWRLFDAASAHPVVFEGWNALWEGLAVMEDRRLVVTERLDLGDPVFEWEVRQGPSSVR